MTSVTTHRHVVSFTLRLIVYSAESVPEFNPPLVANFEFTSHKTLKNFLLTKCKLLVCPVITLCVFCPVINGEKAAYSTPVFADKRERTLDLLLKNIEQKNYSTKVKHDVDTICIV